MVLTFRMHVGWHVVPNGSVVRFLVGCMRGSNETPMGCQIDSKWITLCFLGYAYGFIVGIGYRMHWRFLWHSGRIPSGFL